MKNKLIKKVGLFLIIITLSSFSILDTVDPKDYKNSNLRYQANEAFGFGERLEYKVGYKFITAGYGYYYIKNEPVYQNGRPCYDINFTVKSLPELEMLYKVRDSYRTLLDVGGIFPWAFEQHVREGNYKKDFSAKFDQLKNKAYVDKDSFNVPTYVHDIVSAFYYVRTLNLQAMKKNEVIYLKNFFEDSTFTLGVKMLGRQTVEVESGKFNCLVIEPMVTQGGLFKKEGRLMIWVTDDERKIAVKVGTQISIGFVGAELTKYSGLRGPIKSKIG